VVCSYEALVDGLRLGPKSYTSLTYHSQLSYEFLAKDGRPRAARFRLIAAHRHHDDSRHDNAGDEDRGCDESGLLDANQQDDIGTKITPRVPKKADTERRDWTELKRFSFWRTDQCASSIFYTLLRLYG